MQESFLSSILQWDPGGFIEYDDHLYFTATTNAHGVEIWKIKTCTTNLEINYSPIPDSTYRAAVISSDGTVPSDGQVIFNASNQVNLDNGFGVNLGGEFESSILGCP